MLDKRRRRINRANEGFEPSEEFLTARHLAVLSTYDDGSLRIHANALTVRSGHGIFILDDGTGQHLAGKQLSITRRVLDNFEPVRADDLDMDELAWHLTQRLGVRLTARILLL